MAGRKRVERRVRVEFVLKEEGPIVREGTVGKRVTDAVFGAVSDYMLDVHDPRLIRSDTPKALPEHVDYAVVYDATTGEELYRTPARGFPVKRTYDNDFDILEAIRNTTDAR